MTWELVVLAVLYGTACGGVGLSVHRWRNPWLSYGDALSNVAGAVGGGSLVAVVFLTVTAVL